MKHLEKGNGKNKKKQLNSKGEQGKLYDNEKRNSLTCYVINLAISHLWQNLSKEVTIRQACRQDFFS